MVRTSDLQVNSLALYLLSYEGRREFSIELREELRRKLKEVMGEEEEERKERNGLESLLLEV